MHFGRHGIKILVTGDLGYIGSAVIKELRNQFPRATLIGFDTGYFSSSITGYTAPETLLDRQIYGDIRNFPYDLLEEIDIIIHLAAISNDPIGKTFSKVTWDVNHKASCELARRAGLAGVEKFVFASSCSVYGYAENESNLLTEESKTNPLTDYAESKLAVEDYLQKLSKDTAMEITCFRFATAFGWSDRLRLDIVVNDFVASAITRGKINIASDGKPFRPLIHVNDMAKAIAWGISVINVDFTVLNAGFNANNYTVMEIAELVQHHTYDAYKTDIFVNKNAIPDKRSYQVDFSKFQDLTGLEGEETNRINDQIKELVNRVRDLNLDFKYGSGKLIRLNQLNDLTYYKLLDKELYWKHDRN